MVPLISNGEPCWAQPPNSTAGGAADRACDICKAISVLTKKYRQRREREREMFVSQEDRSEPGEIFVNVDLLVLELLKHVIM